MADHCTSTAGAGGVQAASVGGTLYAYPAMGGNGYFLYYNKQYITPEQAGSWAGLLEAANAAGKQVTMQLNSGWYLYGFFKGAGYTCSLGEDKTSTLCDWNTTGGTDVVQAILDITANPGFINLDDGAFVNGEVVPELGPDFLDRGRAGGAGGDQVVVFSAGEEHQVALDQGVERRLVARGQGRNAAAGLSGGHEHARQHQGAGIVAEAQQQLHPRTGLQPRRQRRRLRPFPPHVPLQ